MTDRCNKNETESELMYDDLSDAPNNTCDENEFSDSSNILELSDVIRRRISLPKKYMRKYAGFERGLSEQSAVRNVLTNYKLYELSLISAEWQVRSDPAEFWKKWG